MECVSDNLDPDSSINLNKVFATVANSSRDIELSSNSKNVLLCGYFILKNLVPIKNLGVNVKSLSVLLKKPH